ncbi:MAG: 50S ribosomal protein L23 [Candidatus Staskawiczbacteria bacterium]|jgi:large subunit ribosomal protein L23
MALFDFLKKKKQIEKAKEGKKTERKPAKKSDKISVEKKQEPVKTESPYVKTPATKAKNVKFSYEAIKQPHISEKATDLGEKNQYIFEVSPNYNKNEIKNAVEGIYGVDVLSVNVIKIPAKKRRLGKTEGWRKAYKKAVVKIKEGQKIEIL